MERGSDVYGVHNIFPHDGGSFGGNVLLFLQDHHVGGRHWSHSLWMANGKICWVRPFSEVHSYRNDFYLHGIRNTLLATGSSRIRLSLRWGAPYYCFWRLVGHGMVHSQKVQPQRPFSRYPDGLSLVALSGRCHNRGGPATSLIFTQSGKKEPIELRGRSS